MELSLSDIQILMMLQKDSRLSYREIASKTGLSTPTVSNRVESLTKMGLIKSYTIQMDTEMLGEVTILLTIDTKPSEVTAIAEELKGREEIKELYILDGTKIHAKTTVLDNPALYGLLEELRAIPEINNITYSSITQTIKESPRTSLVEGLTVTIPCYYCRKPITENPVKIKMDNKDHYLCCNSCSKLYQEKYQKLKEGAKKHDASHHH
jgi:DNA-binding Lrp family transcriptional regulator